MTGPEQVEPVLEMDLGELEVSRRVLRAQLAGMALQGILARAPRFPESVYQYGGTPVVGAKAAAADAVAFADALLEELERTG